MGTNWKQNPYQRTGLMGVKNLMFNGDYIGYSIEKTGKIENGKPQRDHPPTSPIRH
jgi:hypothetical protein